MHEYEQYIGFDTETRLICTEYRYPPMVCLTVYTGEKRGIWSVADPDVDQMSDMLLGADKALLIGHNTSYDLMILARRYPQWISRIFQLFDQGRVSDTLLREKLLHVTTHGSLDTYRGMKLEWGIAAVGKYWLGKDRKDEKKLNDSWRLNYVNLEHLPSGQWPQDAIDYAIEDAEDARAIWFKQEERRQQIIQERGFDPFITEKFNVAVDFALALTTDHGMEVDPVAKAEIEAMLRRELAPDKLQLLTQTGILRPGEPPRPVKRAKPDPVTGEVKMTKGTDESINEKKLHEYVIAFAEKSNLSPDEGDKVRLRYTEKGNLQVDKLFMEEYAHLDPVLLEYQHRQKLQKLVNTYIPCMNTKDEKGEPTTESAKYVYPQFNALVETGRTSSFAGKKPKFPTMNGQNVDPRIRGCIVPRSGRLLFSIDITGMELCTAGQTCFDLFGYSVLMDKINAGVDVHGYLGAQLALKFHPDFRTICMEEGVHTPDDVFAVFNGMKSSDNDAVKAIYKHYRKFAKPTNLGYPGGLGAKTFIGYAKATFDVEVDIVTAKDMKATWLDTFTEFNEYFRHINNDCVDPWNTGKDEKTGEQYKKYHYFTPMGFHRAGCTFCACANGKGLQSPSAEGAKTGHFNVVRACYDPACESILYGKVFPNCFIHDEVFGEIEIDDPVVMHARIKEMQRIMQESFQPITPNVMVKTEAALMRRWNKIAEPVYDSAGVLQVWEPKAA